MKKIHSNKRLKSESKASHITTLTPEILENIFSHLQFKAQIRRVCKSFYNATGGDTIRFACFEGSPMEEFGSDLLKYPTLRYKVRYLRIKSCGMNAPDCPDMLVDHILPACPNLVELVLAVGKWNSGRFVERLNQLLATTNTTPLPRLLQRYDVWVRHQRYSEDYVKVLRKLCSSLIQLNLTLDSAFLQAVKRLAKMELDNFIARFDFLNYISLDYSHLEQQGRMPDIREKINLQNLFANPKGRLEFVGVKGQVYLQCDALKPWKQVRNTPTQGSLKEMELTVEWMDISCFEFIVNKLKNIHTLTVRVKNSINCLRMGTKGVEAIVQSLRAYCERRRGAVSVNFRCQQEAEQERRIEISRGPHTTLH